MKNIVGAIYSWSSIEFDSSKFIIENFRPNIRSIFPKCVLVHIVSITFAAANRWRCNAMNCPYLNRTIYEMLMCDRKPIHDLLNDNCVAILRNERLKKEEEEKEKAVVLVWILSHFVANYLQFDKTFESIFVSICRKTRTK